MAKKEFKNSTTFDNECSEQPDRIPSFSVPPQEETLKMVAASDIDEELAKQSRSLNISPCHEEGKAPSSDAICRENDELENNGEDVQSESLDDEPRSIILGLISQLGRGMDLHRITLPTFVLEPRSMLERITDFMSHPDLIMKTHSNDDPLARFLEVVRYFMSGWHIRPKGVKKPYNPVLGEFFRCSWEYPQDRSRSYYIAEQVSHHPPISAYFYCNLVNKTVITGTFQPKSKFLGNSAATIMKGNTSIRFLNRPGEIYYITNPNVYVRGILFGKMLIEMGDEGNIECPVTGYSCKIDFKVKGFFTGSYNCISGKLRDKNGKVLFTLSGKWTDSIYLHANSPTTCPSPVTSFETPNNPVEHKKQADGTQVFFDAKTAHVHPKVVSSESNQDENESRRLWSKVTKALLNKDIDTATVEKQAIEEAQRALRKVRENDGLSWSPRFFKVNPNLDYEEPGCFTFIDDVGMKSNTNISSYSLRSSSPSVTAGFEQSDRNSADENIVIDATLPSSSTDVPIIIPSYSSWFDSNVVNNIEIRSLAEIASENSSSYKNFRNEIIQEYRNNPKEYLSLSALRKSSKVGSDHDVDFDNRKPILRSATLSDTGKSLLPIQKTSPLPSSSAQSSSISISKKRPLENISPDEPSPKVILSSLNADIYSNCETILVCSTCNTDIRVAASSSNAESSLEDSKPEEQQQQIIPVYYHCLKDKRINICCSCFTEGLFSAQYSSVDFVRLLLVPPSLHEGVEDEDTWTDNHTLLLLEGLELYGDSSWDKVTEHIATNTNSQNLNKEMVVARFLSLPILNRLFDAQFNDLDPLFPFKDSSNPVMSLVTLLASCTCPSLSAVAAKTALSEYSSKLSSSNSKDSSFSESELHISVAKKIIEATSKKAAELAHSEHVRISAVLGSLAEKTMTRIELKLQELEKINSLDWIELEKAEIQKEKLKLLNERIALKKRLCDNENNLNFNNSSEFPISE